MATLLGEYTLIGRVSASLARTAGGLLSTGFSPSTEWRNKIIRDRLVRNALKPKAQPSLNTVFEPNKIPHPQIPIISDSGNVYAGGLMTASTIANERLRDSQSMRMGRYTFKSSIYTPVNRIANVASTMLALEDKFKKARVPAAGVYIINRISTSPYQILKLQNRPSNVSVHPETNWAVIKSMGRNNPMYHYTGAEDTVSFSISWYCNNKIYLDEVLAKCKLLESWSKADGYLKSPPILELQFGDCNIEDSMFGGQYFILWSAPYELRNITTTPSAYNTVGSTNIGDNDLVKMGILYPQVATQELTFKRVTDHNLLRSEIMPTKLLSHAGIMTAESTGNINPLKV